MQHLINYLAEQEAFAAVAETVAGAGRARASRLVGVGRALLAAGLFQRLRRTVLVVTGTAREAESWYSDLHGLVRGETDDLAPPVRLFPSLPTLLYDEVGVDRQLVGQRLDTTEALLRGEAVIVVAPLPALLHRVIPPDLMRGSELSIAVGQQLDPRAFLKQLDSLGYLAHDPVLQPGQCALRGGIVDVYPMTAPQPLRVEFWGDEIESIRYFDVNSQRSTLPQQRFTVTVSRESVRTRALDPKVLVEISRTCERQARQLEAAGRELESKRLRGRVADDLRKLEAGEPFDGGEHYLPFLYEQVATLLDYLPPEAVVMVDRPDRLDELAERLAGEVQQVYQAKLTAGAVLSLPAPLYVGLPAGGRLWSEFGGVDLLDGPADDAAEDFCQLPLPSFERDLDAGVKQLATWQTDGYRLMFCTHQVGRLRQVLTSHDLERVELADPELGRLPKTGEVLVVDHRFSGGFLSAYGRLGVLTDQEVFGWHRARRLGGRRMARRGSTALASLTELAPGDHVVHIHHGIGVYQGLVTRTIGGIERDFLEVDYQGTDRLFVPVTELDRLQKYIGSEGLDPELNSLGDNRWKRTKRKARQKAEEVARELVELYARRSVETGHAFAPDTRGQLTMENAFIYDETRDQQKAIDEVKQDMERPQPMDRLLCGDVGFGKTEVAVRAAFKAVEDKLQVAVLVPTTVLAQQHFATFTERLGPFGVRVELLSRFRARKEQAETLTRLAAGEVDVVIGTHRLLSKDIQFHRLGLLVIDEEQRFGVKHKDRIKQLRLGVDVLTMSATPIPRTLHSALVGVRDLSIIAEPPEGRLPVHIEVGERTNETVREAILRELDRDGQVYLLHNRVSTIERTARQIERLVPRATVGFAHGQMAEDELEEVMMEMYAGRYDVLVCTTIIENGLDIPNVNTILVEDCDNFGLAQLYQLCGRVGRRERQAYAYLLHRPQKTLTDIARRRLQAIVELSDLGSGFQIALRDLEIRGAGSLFGVTQSGFMAEVGYELYAQMLADALRRLGAGEPVGTPLTAGLDLDLPVQAHFPPFYITDEQQRLDLYRRLAGVGEAADLVELELEVKDRFGRPPAPVQTLFRLIRLRLDAVAAGLDAVHLESGHLVLQFAERHELDAKELRVFQRHLARQVVQGPTPKLRLACDAITANLREPRRWEPMEAAERLVPMIVAARQDMAVAVAAR